MKILYLHIFFCSSLFSQHIDYEARSYAYEYCKCINSFNSFNEEIVDLLIYKHTHSEFDIEKILSKRPGRIREEYERSVLTYDENMSIFVKCSEEIVKRENDASLIDSNSSIIDDVILYLSYDYNCKLARFILKNFN